MLATGTIYEWSVQEGTRYVDLEFNYRIALEAKLISACLVADIAR